MNTANIGVIIGIVIIALFISGPIAWFIVWWLLLFHEKSNSISRKNYWILLISLWIAICIGVAYLFIGISNLFNRIESCQECKSKYN